MSPTASFDVVVLGGGPGGQKAAIQGAKAGRRVLLVDDGDGVGGECVRRGTIPSKTLRETAVSLQGFRARTAGVFPIALRDDLTLDSLMTRMRSVVEAHVGFMGRQLDRNGVTLWRGRARFCDARTVEVQSADGVVRRVRADAVIIAVGSRPRTPPGIPVDHEHVLDSDSFLSMTYLPRSLTVLGAGVIASEYASIFASLGTRVTMVDRGERPVSFLDRELTDAFVAALERAGGRFIGGDQAASVEYNGIDAVETTLKSGLHLSSEKVLCALGRVANVSGLRLEAAGIATDERGLVPVDSHGRTCVPGIYAVGDVIGPPALASSAMDQGRRAVRHLLGLDATESTDLTPMAVYTIPEMSSVGLSEAQAVERYGGAVVGRARFEEIARGQISAAQGGLLKLVTDPAGEKLLGVQIVGEGAAELVHVGLMALLAKQSVDVFIDTCFNFPTLAEAYRVAALDVVGRRR